MARPLARKLQRARLNNILSADDEAELLRLHEKVEPFQELLTRVEVYIKDNGTFPNAKHTIYKSIENPRTKGRMTEEENTILQNLRFKTEQSAWYARVLAAVIEFQLDNGRLPSLKTQRTEYKSKEEQKLANELANVRRARWWAVRGKSGSLPAHRLGTA